MTINLYLEVYHYLHPGESENFGHGMIVVVAIFSTVGLACSLADRFNDYGLFGEIFFISGCLLVLGAVVTQGL